MSSTSPLSALRHWLEASHLDGMIVPRADAWQSEYCAPYDEKLAWLNNHYIKQADNGRLADLVRPRLAARGITSAEAAAEALERDRSLSISPMLMRDMDRAVAEGKVHYDEATGSWRQGAAAVKEIGTEAKQTRDYMDEINAVARKTAAEIPATLGKAAETLGLDFERANGRIGESFKETLGALDTLVQHSGSSSAACEEYLAAAFNQAKNKAEIDAVIERMQAMAKQGQLTGDGIARSMAIAADAMGQVKGGSGDAKTAVAAIPNVRAFSTVRRTFAACSHAFVGMQPRCRHVPPTGVSSKSATLSPSWAPRSAAA